MNCLNCGHEMKDIYSGTMVCPVCGYEIKADERIRIEELELGYETQ